jgi:hypothetical protein
LIFASILILPMDETLQTVKGTISAMFRLGSSAVILIGILLAQPTAAESNRALVGHVMALLSVFERAGVLPPESSPEANNLIHALIQTQAALAKSTDPATQRWFGDALQAAERAGIAPAPSNALTSRTLEAIVDYAEGYPPGNDPQLLAGLNEFGIGQNDLRLLARIFRDAERRLRSIGLDIHALYTSERRAMPLN